MEFNWCKYYEFVFLRADDHDSREKMIDSLSSLIGECRTRFSSADSQSIQKILSDLESEYKRLASDEIESDEGNYFGKMLSKIQSLRSEFNSSSNKVHIDL